MKGINKAEIDTIIKLLAIWIEAEGGIPKLLGKSKRDMRVFVK
jgi:hypothetical protein